MKHHGRVAGVDSTGAAFVELDTLSQCARCKRGEGCGSVSFNAQGSSITVRVESANCQLLHETDKPIANEHSKAVGQAVLVEIDDSGSDWLWPVLGAYGLPLFFMLLTTGLTSLLTSMMLAGDSVNTANHWAEVVVLASAGLGLYGGVFAWRWLSSGHFSYLLTNAERSLCLQSARIVAINPSST